MVDIAQSDMAKLFAREIGSDGEAGDRRPGGCSQRLSRRALTVSLAAGTLVALLLVLLVSRPSGGNNISVLEVQIKAQSAATGVCGVPVTFPQPRVQVAQAPRTQEQAWMAQNWPGYQNGVNFGGIFVIEDWMFSRSDPPYDLAKLRPTSNPWKPFAQHEWCQAMLEGDRSTAFQTFDCHVTKYLSDADLDSLAEFGITAVRVPVGYWLFDDENLYPQDAWIANMSGTPAYGINPDGFITPGTQPLTDMVVKLHNRNIKVILDMHANPGCSSPHQSHAGIMCDEQLPNLWAGLAQDGVCGHPVHRAKDGKTWRDVARKIALERVVPWIKFIEGIAPGTIIGFEPVNEPDSPPAPKPFASIEAVRAITLDLGREVSTCLGDLAQQVNIIISSGVKDQVNYASDKISQDYLSPAYINLKDRYVTDVHHYYAWEGCQEGNSFSVKCACEANLPGGDNRNYVEQDQVWNGFMQANIPARGFKMMIGEWSAGLGPAHACHNGKPAAPEAKALYQAQKWDFLSQHLAYKNKSTGGQSSFIGDFYWNVRMGYHWNVDPAVCSGPTQTTDYERFDNWDWSLLRLIKLGLAKPLSQLGLSPEKMITQKDAICTGSFPVRCR